MSTRRGTLLKTFHRPNPQLNSLSFSLSLCCARVLSFLVEDLVVKTYVPLCLSLVIWLGGLAGIVAMYSLKSSFAE